MTIKFVYKTVKNPQNLIIHSEIGSPVATSNANFPLGRSPLEVVVLCWTGRDSPLRYICTEKLRICTDKLHICTEKLHICTEKLRICTEKLHICTENDRVCTEQVILSGEAIDFHGEAIDLYGEDVALTGHRTLSPKDLATHNDTTFAKFKTCLLRQAKIYSYETQGSNKVIPRR